MKIIKGKKYYSKSETAELIGMSTQTLVLWDKESVKLEAEGKERLIPKPIRIFPELKGGHRYWFEGDIADIIAYSHTVKKGRKFSDESKNKVG